MSAFSAAHLWRVFGADVVLNTSTFQVRRLATEDTVPFSKFLCLSRGAVELRSTYTFDVEHGNTLLRSISLAMRQGWRGLEVLHCSDTYLGDPECAKLAGCHIFQEPNGSIQLLDKEFAAALPERKIDRVDHIRELRLRNNSIGSRGMFCMAIGSILLKNLRCLDLSFNDIGVQGAGYLASALPSCRELRRLDLTCCGLRAMGIGKLAANLGYCPMEELYLGCNSIGDDGMASFVRWQAQPPLTQVEASFLVHLSSCWTFREECNPSRLADRSLCTRARCLLKTVSARLELPSWHQV